MLDVAGHAGDMGDAYEYLIGRLRPNSGKKAGEFYAHTQPVAKLMTQDCLLGREDEQGFTI